MSTILRKCPNCLTERKRQYMVTADIWELRNEMTPLFEIPEAGR